MDDYFEIAYAATSHRLCFFTGTGFSKSVSGNSAPSWQALLENLGSTADIPKQITETLFPSSGRNPLALDEAAQIISIELRRLGKNIYDEAAQAVRDIQLSGDNSAVSEFFANRPLRVVTTNYDKLAEMIAGETESQSISPGLPIPRSNARVKVYHVHGSVDSPSNMVITADDYHKFLNSESYFSRKLSTVLHENTVVILGYSLGDTNLKSIISNYRDFARSHVIGSSIFLVTRERIAQSIVDYYSHSYGIRVLAGVEIAAFFGALNRKLPQAEAVTKQSIDWVKLVLFKNHLYSEEYIASDVSFHTIIPSIAAVGVSINNARVVEVLGDIIAKKTKLTGKSGAWDQYQHLAGWLAYLACLLEIKDTAIEETFLKSALRSMTTMSKKTTYGYSWHAYHEWSERWNRITSSNRALLRQYIEANTSDPDALEIVRTL